MKKLILPLCCVFLAVVTVSCGGDDKEAAEKAKQLESENTELKAEVQKLADELKSCKEQAEQMSSSAGLEEPKSDEPAGTSEQSTKETKQDRMDASNSGSGRTVTEEDTESKKDRMSGDSKASQKKVTEEDTKSKKDRMKGN